MPNRKFFDMDKNNTYKKVSVVAPMARTHMEPSDIQVVRDSLTEEASFESIGQRDSQSEISTLNLTNAATLLQSLYGKSGIKIQKILSNQMTIEFDCSDVSIMRLLNDKLGRVYLKDGSQLGDPDDYKIKDFPLISQVIESKRITKFNSSLTSNMSQWTNIFSYQPDTIVLIPIPIKHGLAICAVIIVSFKSSITEDLMGKLIGFRNSLNLLLPYCVSVQTLEDERHSTKNLLSVFDSLDGISKIIGELALVINEILLELQRLTHCESVVVFVANNEDKVLFKYCAGRPGKVDKECPDPESHVKEHLEFKASAPISWVVNHKQSLIINQPSDCLDYGIRAGKIHSIGCCLVDNAFCIPISDFSGECPLVVEISNKLGGFTSNDEYKIHLFARHVSSILTSSVQMDHRRRSIARNDITNEVIRNIQAIRLTKVEEFTTNAFDPEERGLQELILEYNFSPKMYFSDHEACKVIFYMFSQLDMLKRWKIRRTTLIRFILSVCQGYRDIPYHNWKHAVTVTHFAFIILRKVQLVHRGILTDLEAFSLLVACISHDIDHRATNNHFHLITESELYHFYKKDQSVMERHHLAVTIGILTCDDCNIVESLTESEFKEFIDLLSHNILATDLMKYLTTRDQLFATLANFDSKSTSDRRALLSVIMTSCDLSDAAKKWDDNLKTVKCIFEEFFAQGDQERSMGQTPLPMFDRRVAYIPDIEMKFLNNIVRPVFHALSDIFPETYLCLVNIDYCKELWLLSTQVFDEHADNPDSLSILDLDQMKEESLNQMSNPHLLEKLHERRFSISPAADATLRKSVINISNSLEIIKPTLESRKTRASIFLDAEQAEALANIRHSHDEEQMTIFKKPSLWDKILNYVTCGRHYKKIYPLAGQQIRRASFVEKRKQFETEYMEERAHDYSRRRSEL